MSILAFLTPQRSALGLIIAAMMCAGLYLWADNLSYRLDVTQEKLEDVSMTLAQERAANAMVRAALSKQIMTLHDIAARDANAEEDRLLIMSTCGVSPAKPGETVDDKTSRAVIDHINRSLD